MAQDRRRQPLDVVGCDEFVAANRRQRLRRPVKSQRGAGLPPSKTSLCARVRPTSSTM